jgi:beta-glucanase (GH16 family)
MSSRATCLAGAMALLAVAGCSSGSGSASPGQDGGESSSDGAVDTGLASGDSGSAGDSSASDGPASGHDSGTAHDASGDGSDDAGPDAALPGWTLTWADEFNGPSGAPPDPKYWSHDVGGQGWGNSELEYYTDGAANTYQENGNLVIVATTTGASSYMCANDGNPGPCQYTSGRIVTQQRAGNTGFSQTYGRFEARMQLPAGAGLWPAFWMLGTDIDTAGWPACGETDVMEYLGQDTSTAYGHLHMPQGSGGNYGPGASFKLPSGGFDGGFHVFAVQWQMGQIDFFVDGTKYTSVTSASIPSDATWEFDGKPFFLLLNLAVGSKDSWPGAPTSSTVFPAKVLVDYVRVYKKP